MTEKCTRVPVRVGEDAGVSEDETIGGSEALGVFPLGDDVEDAEQRADLEAQVLSELLALRRTRGRLSIQKFSRFAVLRRVCGGDDLLDAFLMFQRELERYKGLGRDEAAAAWSLCAGADTVLDRLQLTAEALSSDEWRDQRTARRWSDAGMPALARDLVYFARVSGRLGVETLSVELGGDDSRLSLIVDQMTTAGLPVRSPLVQVWHYPDDEEPREVAVDLDRVAGPVVEGGGRRLHRHRLVLELPDAGAVQVGEAVLAVSVTGRDAPMRTVFYEDHSDLGPDLSARLAVYRSIVTIEIARAPDSWH